MKKPVLFLFAALLAPATLTAQDTAVAEAAATITADEYAWRVGVIAHDSMQGRDTPSQGLEKTATWIASEFRRMGLHGGAEDGGFIQRYPLRSVALDAESSGLTIGGTRLGFGDALLPLLRRPDAVEATGGVVLVSGSRSLEAALASGAVEGNHAVFVLPADAAGIDQELFRSIAAVLGAGALSVIVTNSTDDERWASNAERALAAGVQKGWGPQSPTGNAFSTLLQVRTDVLAEALRAYGVNMIPLQARADGDVEIRVVQGAQATLSMAVREETVGAPNVVGILEGSDPTLRDEYVVFSGHMDHVGIGSPDASGDSIYNGADDDASGTIAVVEIAEAMSSLPTAPRRSMLFLLVSGEEKGLWGSEWFADNPTRPIEQMVANLNADMVGRNWTDTIVAIGKEHSDLGATLERVNAAHPELRMTAIDDIWPEESFYTRSDHYNFARRGVPILFFFSGTHPDYHRPSDEVDKIDAEKAARISRLVFYLGVEIGNATERPKWNPESYARIVSDR